jgi:hypothetical protein
VVAIVRHILEDDFAEIAPSIETTRAVMQVPVRAA